MDKPIEPTKEDCCNSGCNPCIFDIYEKQLNLYNKLLESGEEVTGISQENGISQLEYTKFTVVKIANVCEMHNLILFKRSTLDVNKVWWNPGHHFLYKFITDEFSCTRAYTPIMIENEPKNNYDFAIVVKKYDNGVISTHLYNMQEGNTTLWRGPYGHYEMEPNKFDRIIMIAQGTGIAPFITILKHILNNEEDMTRVTLLYCCKCINTILFRELFYNYKSYWNFKYEIYLSSFPVTASINYQEPMKQQKLSVKNLEELKPYSAKDQFLICGSQQFNTSYDEFIRKEYLEIENIVLF